MTGPDPRQVAAMRPRDILLGVAADLDSPFYDRPGRQRRHEWAKRIQRALDALEAEHEAELRAEEDRANLPSAAAVDWDDIERWGGGVHEAAWAPDGTHDDITEEE